MKRRVLKKKYKKLLLNILLIILIFIFLASTYNGIRIIYYGNRSKKNNTNLVNDVVNINKKTKATTIDFEKLKNINVDVVAWINIPDTHINYPVMQTFDNKYYLKRDFNNEYNINGSIYMDYNNKSDFSDPNTIIYGHYTHSTDMFSDLKGIYENSSSKDVNVYIYTPQKDYVYKAYSMYVTNPNDSKPINSSTSSFTKSEKDFNIDLEKKEIKQTLTLVTCYNDSNRRLILHAYLKQEKS